MTTHAGAIAAKLQGAHERRRRGEDTEMGKAESVWTTELEKGFEIIRAAAERHLTGHTPQASAVSAERVVELERQLAEARNENEALQEYYGEKLAALEEPHTDCYVPREVPWADVAAGMMTLSREEHPRPWMVESRGTNWVDLTNGSDHFRKEPAEGVARVLVPYVTDEQAEATLRAAGATEVSS